MNYINRDFQDELIRVLGISQDPDLGRIQHVRIDICVDGVTRATVERVLEFDPKQEGTHGYLERVIEQYNIHAEASR